MISTCSHRRIDPPRFPIVAGLFLISLSVLGAPAAVRAQDDPFAPPPGDSEPREPMAEPGDTPAAATAAEPAEQERDPVVLAVEETNPTTPAELVRAIRIMMDLGRFDVANRYLERLTAIELSEEVLRSLYSRFGESFFLRLMRAPELAPQGTEFGGKVLAAARAAARDPARIAGLVERAADPAQRAAALGTLRGSSQNAVGPLLQMLADPARAEEHVQIQRVLVAMSSAVTDPLKAALESPDPALRQKVIQVLGARRERSAIPLLVGSAFGEATSAEERSAARAALRRITGHAPSPAQSRAVLTEAFLERWQHLAPSPTGRAIVWRWDADQQTSVPTEMAAADLERHEAQRLATLLAGLEPDNESLQVWSLAARLELAQALAGLEQSLANADASAWDALQKTSAARASAALAFALESDRPAAAIGAAQLLGAIGTVEQLLPGDPTQWAPLTRALNYPNQLVQAAAVDAIMAIQPTEAFAGSSRFREMLEYFLRTSGPRRVLVATPRLDEGQTLIGLLNGIGYEADWAPTGKRALALASFEPDYEFALVSDSLTQPATDEFVQLLRASGRSAALPVAVMIRDIPILFPGSPRTGTPILPGADEEGANAANTEAPDAEAAEDTSAAPATDTNRDTDGVEAPNGTVTPDDVPAGAKSTPAPVPPTLLPGPAPTASELAEAARIRFEKYEKIRTLEFEDPLVFPTPRPHSIKALQLAISQLPARDGRATVSPVQRVERSRAILRWIAATLTSEHVMLYDILRLEDDVAQLVFVPELSADATAVLGVMATPRSQQLLVDVASQPALAIEIRTAAAEAFAHAVQRRGVLLTTDAILVQYERYNASATMDRATQQVLGSLLDALEAPALSAAAGKAPPSATHP